MDSKKKQQPVMDDKMIAEGALVPRIMSSSSSGDALGDPMSSFDNRLHIKVDWAAALAAYGFGSAMHVAGQSTALCTLSMWLAGTCFIMNTQNRAINGLKSDAFQLEAVGSWIWMLSSFQQFRQFKTLKYAGYSSWTGLGMVGYFSFRHLLQTMSTPS